MSSAGLGGIVGRNHVGEKRYDYDSSSDDECVSRGSVSSVTTSQAVEGDGYRAKYKRYKTENEVLKTKVSELEKRIERIKKEATRTAWAEANTPVAFDSEVYSRVNKYARKAVFRIHKFFTCDRDLADFNTPNSPGNLVMTHFKVSDGRKGQYWMAYKSAVEEGVNYSRHSVQTLIGKALKSKYSVCVRHNIFQKLTFVYFNRFVGEKDETKSG